MDKNEYKKSLDSMVDRSKRTILTAPISAFYWGLGIGAVAMYLLLKGILVPLLVLAAIVIGVIYFLADDDSDDDDDVEVSLSPVNGKSRPSASAE